MVSHIIDLQDTVTQNFREKKSYFRNSIANLSRNYLNQHRWSPNTKLLARTFRTTPIYIYIYMYINILPFFFWGGGGVGYSLRLILEDVVQSQKAVPGPLLASQPGKNR